MHQALSRSIDGGGDSRRRGYLSPQLRRRLRQPILWILLFAKRLLAAERSAGSAAINIRPARPRGLRVRAGRTPR